MPLKTVLITGCSAGGIGAALALSLAKRGHRIFATARNTSKIPEALTSLSNVTTLTLDVTSDSSVSEAVKAVAAATEDQQTKGIDVLVNNAGSGYTMPLLDSDIETCKKVHDVNVWGTLRTIKAFSDMLINNKGRIINVSSVGGILYTPWIGAYSSSKAAVSILSETLRLELGPFGVTVLTIMVGTISTGFWANEPSFGLPDGSRYAAAKDTMARWASGEAVPNPQPVEDFAETIVEDVVGTGKGGMVYRGPNSSIVRWVTKLAPGMVVDGFLSSGQGFDEVTKSLQN